MIPSTVRFTFKNELLHWGIRKLGKRSIPRTAPHRSSTLLKTKRASLRANLTRTEPGRPSSADRERNDSAGCLVSRLVRGSLLRELRRCPPSWWAIVCQLPVSMAPTAAGQSRERRLLCFQSFKAPPGVPLSWNVNCLLGEVPKGRSMTPKCAAYKNIQTNRDLVSVCERSSKQLLASQDRDRQPGFVRGITVLAATIVIAVFLPTPAIAQEQHHAYSEYTWWFGGAFGSGHAFSNTLDARNYQVENRYERLIYWSESFAVRWVFDLTSALVGDPRTGNGHRVYSYGIGASPVGAQVNFVHFRRVEPFLTSAGGFLYFNRQMFGQTNFNFTAQLGGGVQLFSANRRTSLDVGYKYHHISNANLGNQNPGMDSHMVFIGLSLFR